MYRNVNYTPYNISNRIEHGEHISLAIFMTFIYTLILIIGVIGNISTCIVIYKSKSLHTATNYYLFSLSMSDLILLVSGLPPEIYKIWFPYDYIFGELFCVIQSFAAETSANATVLTIAAFTIERYIAICHPFLTKRISLLNRALRYIIIVWTAALCLAFPQANQFGIQIETENGIRQSSCTLVTQVFHHAFEISTFVIFFGPMILITVLYILIAFKLRKSKRLGSLKHFGPSYNSSSSKDSRVIKMLGKYFELLDM